MTHGVELNEMIDATAWIDVHEHLVDERHRLREEGYFFTEILGSASWISSDWTSLLVGGYALDDLVSAGLPAAAVAQITGGDVDPLEKWNAVAEYVNAARLTGYMRAVDEAERRRGKRVMRDRAREQAGRPPSPLLPSRVGQHRHPWRRPSVWSNRRTRRSLAAHRPAPHSG